MNSLMYKILILIVLILIFIVGFGFSNIILPILITIIFSCLQEYFNNRKLNILLFTAYFILCIYDYKFVPFLPIISYEMLCEFDLYTFSIDIVLVLFYLNNDKFYIIILVCIIQVFERILKTNLNNILNERNILALQRDRITEDKLILEQKLDELITKQNDQITIATLNERNRIAREIHDNVGHLLSSSILQIGALISTSKDEATIKSLITIKDTLDKGMNSIRSSVHNLRDSSIDLEMQLKKIVDEFNFCSIKLKYEMKYEIKTEAKYSLILIIKEALNNIIKHSNATEAVVEIYEHPKFIQIIVADNGKANKEYSMGMGLEDIEKRVEAFNGRFNINTENGFRVFISIDKENLI